MKKHPNQGIQLYRQRGISELDCLPVKAKRNVGLERFAYADKGESN